ncbi:MAG: HEPN domain-containing protein [Kiritimatiellae bacterium]|nr:HEPN domain-containing protein [Kiritimatiellia bacterium]MDD4737299.1 HEPN domain-containing protein [Kiritimatiellia bacterium]
MDDPRLMRAGRNSFIERSFRDTADRDYISARLLHRHQLTEQFLWMSLQAIEKYLKAILLFADISTRHLRHDIVAALKEACEISALGLKVTPRAEKFIRYLRDQGENRYFTYPRFTEGDELFHLDHTVWQVRRFCDDFFFPHDHARQREFDQARLRYVQGDKIHENRIKFRLDRRGFLEVVLDGKKHETLRAALIWKNFYFAGRSRGRVSYTHSKTWTQPSNLIHTEIVDWAVERVILPKDVVEEMRKRLRTNRSTVPRKVCRCAGQHPDSATRQNKENKKQEGLDEQAEG